MTSQSSTKEAPEGKYLWGRHEGFNSNIYLCLPRTHQWKPDLVVDGTVISKECQGCSIRAERWKGRWLYFLYGARLW